MVIDPTHLRRLVADDPGEADETLDLRGLDRAPALAAVETTLLDRRERRVRVLLDPPAGDGSVSLFPAVGRILLAARKASLLRRLVVLDAGSGFWIHVRGGSDPAPP